MHAAYHHKRGVNALLVSAALPILCCVVMTLGMRPVLAAPPSSIVRWVHAIAANERAASSRWQAAIGSPVLFTPHSSSVHDAGDVVVVSWNTHVGAGDVERLVGDVQAGRITGRVPGETIVRAPLPSDR